jgi:DNA-binding transcriptional MerR regulator
MDEPRWTVGNVSRCLERSRETVIAYERRGLLKSERTASGIRLFDASEVRALKATLAMRDRAKR